MKTNRSNRTSGPMPPTSRPRPRWDWPPTNPISHGTTKPEPFPAADSNPSDQPSVRKPKYLRRPSRRPLPESYRAAPRSVAHHPRRNPDERWLDKWVSDSARRQRPSWPHCITRAQLSREDRYTVLLDVMFDHSSLFSLSYFADPSTPCPLR